MKIFVLGLSGADLEIIFGDERLTNLRRLMELGCYGKLESVIPPEIVPAWLCMSTSQDPGSLGIYGSRNRINHAYYKFSTVDSTTSQETSIWDQITQEEKRSILIGVPPSFPPYQVNGICVGCFLTPDTNTVEYTSPSSIKDQIANVVGDYQVDVKGYLTEEKDWLKEKIFSMSRKQFELVRHFMEHEQWDYFQFVDIGLDRIQNGFCQFYDPHHELHVTDNPFQNVIPEYYQHLDQELGAIFQFLDDETIVSVISPYGTQRLDGGFYVNEWLVKEDLLVLNNYPDKVTPFEELDINWEKTIAWSEAGNYAHICLNIKGRESNGMIDLADYGKFRNEIKSRLEAIPDDKGNSMGTLVFKPEEIYKQVHNIAPDLIAQFGELSWRAIGSVGHSTIYSRNDYAGLDGCTNSRFGSFILTSANNPLQGEIRGAHLLDIAPTLLELGGYDITSSMQGKSLVSGLSLDEPPSDVLTAEEEAILRERLSGLGYI